LRAAYALAKTTPLDSISVVMVARTLGVTPALIHYYVGSRDWLTSGVMNLFYRDLFRKWPSPGADWRSNISLAVGVAYEQFVKYSGISAYAVTHNRFRVFQLTTMDDCDFGAEVLEKLTQTVRTAGRSAERTGIIAHLLLEFVITSAHSTARHLYPAEHKAFLSEKMAALDPEKYPALSFAGQAPFLVDAQVAFREGVRLFLLGLEHDPEAESGSG
jgi:AcrR family transcriptional regulator